MIMNQLSMDLPGKENDNETGGQSVPIALDGIEVNRSEGNPQNISQPVLLRPKQSEQMQGKDQEWILEAPACVRQKLFVFPSWVGLRGPWRTGVSAGRKGNIYLLIGMEYFFKLFILLWSINNQHLTTINNQRCDSSGEQQRDSAIHIHVSSLPKIPSHPGCQITLSRVLYAIQ